MPEKVTLARARRDLRAGKRPSTAAGEFVREEIEHVRRGKHGARSAKQAIAIGRSKARRSGVPLEPPPEGRTSRRTRVAAKRAFEVGQGQGKRKAKPSSQRRQPATTHALRREGRAAASRRALSAQSRSTPRRRHGRAHAS